jgi:hypothetical protein
MLTVVLKDDLGVDKTILHVLEWTVKRKEGRAWMGFIWPRI